MVDLTDLGATEFLDFLTGRDPVSVRWLGLFLSVGIEFVEPTTASGYVRARVTGTDWTAPTGTSPTVTYLDAPVSFFPADAGGWGTLVAWGIFDDRDAGNLLLWDYLGFDDWLEYTAESSVLTVPAHGYANGDLVASSGAWTGLLPVGNATSDTFTLGVTVTGSGSLRRVVPEDVPNGSIIQFLPQQLVIRAA